MSEPTATPTYTGGPVDACDEGAARINVVIALLDAFEAGGCDDSSNPKYTGGYEVTMMRGLLTEIRDLLCQASHEDAELAAARVLEVDRSTSSRTARGQSHG